MCPLPLPPARTLSNTALGDWLTPASILAINVPTYSSHILSIRLPLSLDSQLCSPSRFAGTLINRPRHLTSLLTLE